MTEINPDLIIYRLDEMSNDMKEIKETVQKIELQTTKTNGRVTQLEENYKNCPNNLSNVNKRKNNKTNNFFSDNKRTSTIIILLIVIILVLLGVNINDILKIGI